MKTKYTCSGDRAITVEFGDKISEVVSRRVSAMKREVERRRIYGVEEVVQTYRSLLIYYDPNARRYRELEKELVEIERTLETEKRAPERTVEIPVLYGGEFGPDLELVSRHCGLSVDEVVKQHAEGRYLVHMIGFTPGFPYLGGLDESISAPRRDTPRLKVMKGSVGIAGVQTGIYPIDSPGGWNIIGRTPIKLYSPEREVPVLLEPGDYVSFKIIDRDEYERLENMVERGEL